MKSIGFTLRTVLAWLFILNVTNGEIKIVNKLSRPIYLQSVSNTARPLRTLSANGGWYNEDWQINPEGGGISIKMAVQRDMNDIIQFEYTVIPFETMSSIGMCLSLTPSQILRL